MSRDEVVWRAPQPLWRRALRGSGTLAERFREPAVLRLAGDDFMEQVQAALRTGGSGLEPLVAGAEDWQRPGAGLDTVHEVPPGRPITLFQPVHGRFYLVAASLVCRRYGHPDRRVAADRDESTAFLLRRLTATGSGAVDPALPATFTEHGWLVDPGGGSWQPAAATAADARERRLPMFTVASTLDATPRRLLAGLVPVSGREALHAAPVVAPGASIDPTDPLAPLADPRLRALEPVVVGLQELLADPAPAAALARESLFFALVDVARWLGAHLPVGSPVLPEQFDAQFAAATTWRAALAAAVDAEPEAVFEDGTAAPAPVTGLGLAAIRTALTALGVEAASAEVPATATTFFRAAARALPAVPETLPAPPAEAADPVYVVRFLHERPRCPPAQRQVLSEPTRPFRLAAFHEPDAPARPVRIAYPVDPSPAGLRRFPRNVSVVLSSELRKQMARVSEETLRKGSLEPAPSIGFGMVCQLSIPIISICALILLMIIVQILNIVFFWLPLFKICAPVPKAGA